MKTITGDGGYGASDPVSIHVARTLDDLGHLDDWLQARSGDVLGLDAETNAVSPFDPAYALRTVQAADEREAWVVVQRPWLAERWRQLIHRHDRWAAWFSENDLRFVERGMPGSLRMEQDTPHLADAQVLLAYHEPRTVTAAKEFAITHLGDAVKVQLPRGLKPTATRMISPVLGQVEDALHQRFHDLAPRGHRTPQKAKVWGFANISDEDELYLTYAGLDPLMTVRAWRLMERDLRARGQWSAVVDDLNLQWHIDRFTFRGMLVDAPYARWLDEELHKVIDEHASFLAVHGIPPSGQGPSVATAFENLGLRSASWDKKVLGPLAADASQPVVVRSLASALTGVRKASKFRAAYIKPMLESLTRDGRVHCSMRAHGTITGRQSAARPALQQLPKKDTRVRAAFRAPDGWVFVSCDFSQGEPRTMAARSGDRALMADILAGDFNGALATKTFGAAYDPTYGKVAGTPHYIMRDKAKRGFLSWCYGAGDGTVASTLDMSVSEGAQVTASWRQAYPDLATWRDRLNAQPAVVLESGRVCPLWDRYTWTADGRLVPTSKPSRKGLNYDTQGTQRDLLARAVHLLVSWGWGWALAFLIHDEILCCVPIEMADRMRDALAAAMTFHYHGMPFTCDATIEGRTWMAQPDSFDPAEIVDADEDERIAT